MYINTSSTDKCVTESPGGGSKETGRRYETCNGRSHIFTKLIDIKWFGKFTLREWI